MLAKNPKDWSKQVKERDNYTCKRCFRYYESVEPHHKKPKSRYPELKLEVDNGISLCNDCHRWVHMNPKKAHEAGLFYVRKYE